MCMDSCLYQVKTAILFGFLDVVFPAGTVLITQLFLKRKAQIDVAGFFCVCFSMAAYGSPLSAMVIYSLSQNLDHLV